MKNIPLQYMLYNYNIAMKLKYFCVIRNAIIILSRKYLYILNTYALHLTTLKGSCSLT